MIVLALALPALGAAPVDEQWYALFLQDQRAGWAHDRRVEADGRITSTQTINIQIKRGPAGLAMSIIESFVETAEGKPIEATVTQKLGAMETTQVMTFAPDGITLTMRQGGSVKESTFPLPAEAWLPPAAAQRYFDEQSKAGQQEVAYWTLQPSIGPKAHRITMRRIGDESIEVMGKVVPATAWDAVHSSMPNMASRVYLNDRGQALKTTVPIPGMSMTMVMADEQLAKSNVNPPELLVASLIQPDKPISNARARRRAVYELAITGDGEAMPVLPNTPAQRVEQADGGAVRVSVDCAMPHSTDDAPGDEHRRPSTMLNFEDERVKRLLEDALTDIPSEARPVARAEALRRFVSEYVQGKDLSVGLASASEVARTRQGDCTEHAVLLAALLRGAGIPSRTVSGLMYVEHILGKDGVFGYHMWAQAWLPDEQGAGRWVDLDAVLDGDRAFDATHITLATSAMADGQTFNDMVTFMPVFGRLSIRVIETE